MQIKVIFDKVAVDKSLHVGWGVSFLLDDKILFDTGEKGEWLIDNLKLLKVDINNLEGVIISHDHWDHWGGLWDLLKQRKGVTVYICPNFSQEFKKKALELGAKLIEIEKLTEIIPSVFSSGEIAGAYHEKYMAEQAVILKTKNGITIITGCAHPGIINMIEKIKAKFSSEQIYLAIGGFHLVESDNRAIEIVAENFKKMGIAKAGATHCSGEKAEEIFKKIYQENFIPIRVGSVINI